MKLLISTQIRENYAAHNGFTGEYYWKYKGGNTYIVRGITVPQAMKIAEDGIPTLTDLITEKNEYFEEYILNWEILDDCEADPIDPWETPIEYTWGGDRWLAQRVIDNTTEYGYMRGDIATKTEKWIPMSGGERAHFECEYVLKTGEVLDYKGLEEYYKKEAA